MPSRRQPERLLEGIRKHPSIERLVLRTSALDESLIPILQSLPRLRAMMIKFRCGGREEKYFWKNPGKGVAQLPVRDSLRGGMISA